jgi:hypothetical protein
VPPVGFAVPEVPPAPNFFKNTYDNRGSNINESGLNAYLKPPVDIYVPVPVGNQTVPMALSALTGKVASIIQKLGRPDASLTPEDINTLLIYDAGLIQAAAAKTGMQIDWNVALLEAKERILPVLKQNPPYQGNANYRKVLNDWERAFNQKLQKLQQLQQRQQAQPPAVPQPASQPAPQPPPAPRQGKAPLDSMRQTGQRGGI